MKDKKGMWCFDESPCIFPAIYPNCLECPYYNDTKGGVHPSEQSNQEK
jgi:hypothetical protein